VLGTGIHGSGKIACLNACGNLHGALLLIGHDCDSWKAWTASPGSKGSAAASEWSFLPGRFARSIVLAPACTEAALIAPVAIDCAQPRLSYLIAAKNEARFLAAALHSLVLQSDAGFEAIVVDDHSSDPTVAIAEAFARSYPWLQVCRSPGRGKVAAYNEAFRRSSGELIAFLGADDELPPDSTALRVNAYAWHLQQDRDWHQQADAQELTQRPWLLRGRLRVISYNRQLSGRVLPRSPRRSNPSGGACTFNRAFAERLFPIPEILPSEDAWLALCSESLLGQWQGIPAVVLHYRIHEGNTVPRQRAYAPFDAYLSAREHAASLFLAQYASLLAPLARAAVERLVDAYALRQQHQSLRLLLLPGLPLRTRLRLLLQSSACLYRLFLWMGRIS
jgi:glycosyltransferase involved in cell wall biosynthesis